ncbi:MAG: hypothetical protein PVI60_13105, partial [Desulfobacteraceae bacterium]
MRSQPPSLGWHRADLCGALLYPLAIIQLFEVVMGRDVIHKSFLLLLVLFISAIFLFMVRPFLMALLLAGIFSALAHPLYRRIA